MKDIETVKGELSAELTAKPGIVGVGMTERDGAPAIALLLEAQPSEELVARVRRIAGDHPVVIEVVGRAIPFR
jgi:hypothetical protein